MHDLHGVYMQLTPIYEIEGGKGKVQLLQKSTYGLKQSPKALFEEGSEYFHYGLRNCRIDHSIFFQISLYILFLLDMLMTLLLLVVMKREIMI